MLARGAEPPEPPRLTVLLAITVLISLLLVTDAQPWRRDAWPYTPDPETSPRLRRAKPVPDSGLPGRLAGR
jgi:hypothetical protein